MWQLPLEHALPQAARLATSPTSRTSAARTAGAITAALFLDEFVGDMPWAHLDIAGTMQSDADDGWRTAGCTGFGARLLAELALDFTPPA